MVKYNCSRCGKGFSQKSHYDSHNRRKTPCEDNTQKLKTLIYEIINEKIRQLIDKPVLDETNEKLKNLIYELIDDSLRCQGQFYKLLHPNSCLLGLRWNRKNTELTNREVDIPILVKLFLLRRPNLEICVSIYRILPTFLNQQSYHHL